VIRRLPTLALLIALILLALAAPADAASPLGPLYDIKATWGDTNLKPLGSNPATAEGQFVIQARNIGDAVGGQNLTITDSLPPGVVVSAVHWSGEAGKNFTGLCTGVGTGTLSCVVPAAQLATLAPTPGPHPGFASAKPSGYLPTLYVDVSVEAGSPTPGTNVATISGGGAPVPVTDTDLVPIDPKPSAFGVTPGSFAAEVFDAAYPFGSPVRQAAGHPFEFRFNFDINARTGVNDGSAGDTSRYVISNGQLRSVETSLPQGMIGNPEATPKCDPADFARLGAVSSSTACPADTQVGYLYAQITQGTHDFGRGGNTANVNELTSRVPIYNLVPPKGTLADFAFNAGGLIQGHVFGTLDPDRHYAVKAVTPNISNAFAVRGAEVTIWGVPGDPAHDRFRFYSGPYEVDPALGSPWGSAPIRPFFTTPADCGIDNGGSRIRIDSYEHPGEFTPIQEAAEHMNVSKCDDPRFRFEPEVDLQPTSRDAGGPTGLDVNLKLPQQDDQAADAEELYPQNGDLKAIATPPIKRVVVKLPEGMTVSPSAAQGLSACTPEEIGIDPASGTPNDAPVRCPDSSQFGTLRLKSPALPQDTTIIGHLYIAEPYRNPFGSFLALYLAVDDEDLGIRVKLPGEVRLDPLSGQITTEFDDLPQLPVSEVEMKVKGGLRAGLVNPQTCGRKQIEATFYSWHDRDTPHTVKSSYEITQGPGGTPCFTTLAERSFDPSFAAETLNPLAGAFAPFFVRLQRADTDQDLLVAEGTAPPGLTASLRGIERCAGAAIAAAADPARSGVEEINHPSCPSGSRIGGVEAGAGVGQVLTYVNGNLYLSGPYKDAPASAVAIVPVVAGPFDLGVVVTRIPIYVDPVTAQPRLRSDPLPTIFKGIPVRVRDVRLHLDRGHFIVNPTNCKEMQVKATLSSAEGKRKDAASRFQVGECAGLGLKPKLSFRLFGGTHRGDFPGLKVVFKGRPADANIAGASVALPHSEFIEQAHFKTVCTRVQFAAKQCPAGSVYGHVTAKSPLFEETFSGPVYLRSSNHPLPDIVAMIKGPASLPIEVDLDGRVDSVNGGVRNTFEVVPDVPVSSAVFRFQGGKKSLFVNSTNLCASTNRATAKFIGQNGKRITLRPKLRASCTQP
jgi:hypothetical protein